MAGDLNFCWEIQIWTLCWDLRRIAWELVEHAWNMYLGLGLGLLGIGFRVYPNKPYKPYKP